MSACGAGSISVGALSVRVAGASTVAAGSGKGSADRDGVESRAAGDLGEADGGEPGFAVAALWRSGFGGGGGCRSSTTGAGAGLVTVPFSVKFRSCGGPTTAFCSGAAMFWLESWASAGEPAASRQSEAATTIRTRAFMVPRRWVEYAVSRASAPCRRASATSSTSWINARRPGRARNRLLRRSRFDLHRLWRFHRVGLRHGHSPGSRRWKRGTSGARGLDRKRFAPFPSK